MLSKLRCSDYSIWDKLKFSFLIQLVKMTLNVVCFVFFSPAIVGFGHIRERRDWTIYCFMCHCWFIRNRWCLCARWDGWRSLLDVSWIHPGLVWLFYSFMGWEEKVWILQLPVHAILLQVVLLSLQSFMAGLAASGALTSGLRLVTKAAFEDLHDGLRKGTSMLFLFNHLTFSL